MQAAVAAPAADYWDALESLDADLLASHFASRASFQLADHAPLEGRSAIRRAFVQLFVEVERIEHRTIASWSRNGLYVADADVTFLFNDGQRITFPATTVLWMRQCEILTCRVQLYPDPALLRVMRGF